MYPDECKGRNARKKHPFFWTLPKLGEGDPTPCAHIVFEKWKKLPKLRAGEGGGEWGVIWAMMIKRGVFLVFLPYHCSWQFQSTAFQPKTWVISETCSGPCSALGWGSPSWKENYFGILIRWLFLQHSIWLVLKWGVSPLKEVLRFRSCIVKARV